jgi:hypothetical protein
MARPLSLEPTKDWKINVNATIAGCVEHLLFDNLAGKPCYGARKRLIDTLLSIWLESVTKPGQPPSRSMPSLDEIRELS